MPEALPLPRPGAALSPPVPSWTPQHGIPGAGQEGVKDVLNKPNLHAKVSPPDNPRLMRTNQYFMSTFSVVVGEAVRSCEGRRGWSARPGPLLREAGLLHFWGRSPSTPMTVSWPGGWGRASSLLTLVVSTAGT